MTPHNVPLSLKEKLKTRALTVGSWITLGVPEIAEIMASAGFDWLTIDMEHTAITFQQAQQLIQTIELSGCAPLVRVGNNDPYLIKRVMDSGSHGVIVPQVNSRKEAEQAVSAVKYSPVGDRGVGLGRAQGYGMDFESYKEWNASSSIVIVQIENIRGVGKIDDILSVEGVDGFIVGPYDLSASLGVPGKFDHPEFLEAMQNIRDAMKLLKNRSAGFHVVAPDLNLLREKQNEGYSFLAYSLDTLFLAENCRKDLGAFFGSTYHPRRYVKEIRS
jgi:2-dehydro-3-deoxyglucarate aldolase